MTRTYTVTLADGREFSFPEPKDRYSRKFWKSWLMHQADKAYIANPAGGRLVFTGAEFTRSAAS